jgi:hypothetical protein
MHYLHDLSIMLEVLTWFAFLLFQCTNNRGNSTSALYSKFWMKKSQNELVWLSKMVLAQHFCTGCWGWQKAQQSLKPAVNWWDSLIGPGGLLLVVVVSHLLQSHFQFYRWGWEKVLTTLGCEKYCCRATYWSWVELL